MKPDCKEIKQQLSESRREFWAADATINNLEMKLAEMAARLANEENKCAVLAAENAALKQSEKEFNNFCRQEYYGWEDDFTKTPATDAFLAEVRAQGLEMFAQKCNSKSEQSFASDIRDNWKLLGEHATDFAAKLRKGGNQ